MSFASLRPAAKAAPNRGPIACKVPINVVRDHTGLTDRAIRYYCELELVECERDRRGTRIFDPAAVQRLIIIRDLRRAGASIDRIATVLEAKGDVSVAVQLELASLCAAAEQHASEIRAMVMAWANAEAAA